MRYGPGTGAAAANSSARYGRLPAKLAQRGFVPDEPEVTERIVEPALPVQSPWPLMVLHAIDAAVRAGRYGPLHESVGVVDEYLDSHCRRAYRRRAIPPVALRLGQEEPARMQQLA